MRWGLYYFCRDILQVLERVFCISPPLAKKINKVSVMSVMSVMELKKAYSLHTVGMTVHDREFLGSVSHDRHDTMTVGFKKVLSIFSLG